MRLLGQRGTGHQQAARGVEAVVPIELNEPPSLDEEEKTRVGRRDRPPTLLQLVRSGSLIGV